MRLKMLSRSSEKLYQHNPALNPAAFMLDKDKSEHYAAGSVIIDRAVEGIQAAMQKLQSLTADLADKSCSNRSWSLCASWYSLSA